MGGLWRGPREAGPQPLALELALSRPPPSRCPRGEPAVGAGLGQDGEWHRRPHPSSLLQPQAGIRPPTYDSRQVRNADSESPGTSARRLGLQSPGRASDIPAGCYRNPRVSSARLGRPEGDRTRHLPLPSGAVSGGSLSECAHLRERGRGGG